MHGACDQVFKAAVLQYSGALGSQAVQREFPILATQLWSDRR
jgi:hypothetical protein